METENVKNDKQGHKGESIQSEGAPIELKKLGMKEILTILGTGDFDQIIGAIENETVEFKGCPYLLKTTRQKLELAKDISAFGNSGGGVILMGVRVCKKVGHPHDIAEEIRFFEETSFDSKQYTDIIEAYIYPRMNVEIEWIPSKADNSKGLAYMRISEAESLRKPFLTTKVFDENERELGNVIGFFQRKGDNTKAFTAEAMHHAFKEGLRFDEHLSEIKEGIENLLLKRESIKAVDKIVTQERKQIPATIIAQKVDQRITDAIKAVGLTDDIAYVLVAHPIIDTQIEGLFESRNSDIVKLIDEPQQLRYAGFDISTEERSRIINGELRRTVLKPYKLLEVWRDGMILFAASGGEEFLCWGNYDTEKFLRINAIALIESTYLFHDFVKKVYGLSKASDCRLTTQLLLRNLPCPNRYALPKFRLGSFRSCVEMFWAESTEIQAQTYFDWNETIAEKATYDLVSETYGKFGAEHDHIPYKKEMEGKKVIDVEQIRKIN